MKNCPVSFMPSLCSIVCALSVLFLPGEAVQGAPAQARQMTLFDLCSAMCRAGAVVVVELPPDVSMAYPMEITRPSQKPSLPEAVEMWARAQAHFQKMGVTAESKDGVYIVKPAAGTKSILSWSVKEEAKSYTFDSLIREALTGSSFDFSPYGGQNYDSKIAGKSIAKLGKGSLIELLPSVMSQIGANFVSFSSNGSPMVVGGGNTGIAFNPQMQVGLLNLQ